MPYLFGISLFYGELLTDHRNVARNEQLNYLKSWISYKFTQKHVTWLVGTSLERRKLIIWVRKYLYFVLIKPHVSAP